MRFKAFGHRLDEKQCGLIRKMIKYLTDEDPEIIDLRSFDPEVDKNDLILVYGDRAQRKLADRKCKLKVEFADPYLLDKESAFGDETEYKAAVEKLQQLKKTLDLGNMESIPETKEDHKTEQTQRITMEELPSQLTATNVKKLEKQQLEKGKPEWSGWTTDGKSIRVTVEPEEGQADIQMTFAELYAVMGLKEVFRVKELKIVHKPSDTINQDSTQ